MKTTVKQLAAKAFVVFLLTGINVKTEGRETNASSQTIIETTLRLEDWMTDETIWNTNWVSKNEFVLETEVRLELEDWMLSVNSWILNIDFVEEAEPRLELESWITNEVIWNMDIPEKESESKVEHWMLNEKVWK